MRRNLCGYIADVTRVEQPLYVILLVGILLLLQLSCHSVDVFLTLVQTKPKKNKWNRLTYLLHAAESFL
jgi:hypothetical protein